MRCWLAATGRWGGAHGGGRALTVSLSAVSGVGYAIISNNGYTLVEELDPEGGVERRGTNLALVSSCLPAAQILVGSLSGVAIEALGGGPSVHGGQGKQAACGRLFELAGMGVCALLLLLAAVDRLCFGKKSLAPRRDRE